MEKSLFENLLEGSSLIKKGKLEKEDFQIYKTLIENHESEEELNACLNSNEIHPKFLHPIMKRFLQM